MSITHKTRKLIWARSGNECAFIGCKQHLTLPGELGTDVVVGEESHIVARTLEGPRGTESPPGGDIDGIANILLLCPTHHRILDEQPALYTVGALREMKELHERRIRERQSSDSQLREFVFETSNLMDDGLRLFGTWHFGEALFVVTLFGSEPVRVAQDTWKGAGLVLRAVSGHRHLKIGTYSEADSDITFSVDGPIVTVVEFIFDWRTQEDIPFIEKCCDLRNLDAGIVATRLMDADPEGQIYTKDEILKLYEQWLADGVDHELAVIGLREIGLTNPDAVLATLRLLREAGRLDGAVAECATMIGKEINEFLRARPPEH